MVDRLKNVFYNLSSAGGGSPQDMVGTTVLIPMRDNKDPQQLKLKRILDTGGYGVIYQAQEVKSGQEFAIKRIIAGSEQIADIKSELRIHKSVSGHPHILPFITAVSQKLSDSASSPLVYLIQTELCPYGNLSSLLPLPGTHTYLSLPHVFKFFFQTVQAVSHLHSQTVPIVHRDLKAENLLIDSGENIRLCDFGSAATDCHYPDATWSPTQRGLLQEELARYTTPSYRSPEMLDMYSNQPIDCRADIWALGCLLYHICFLRHPFQEGSTLPILSAQYSFPPQDSHNKDPLLFQPLIRSLIKPFPEERPSADGVVASLYHYAMQVGFDLEALDKVPKLYNLTPSPPSVPAPPQREERPTSDLKREPSPSSYYSGLNSLLGRVKGGADSLIKNIKEKVASSSQLPILHLTSRLLVSVVPDEKSAPLIRDLLDRDHNESYLIFNLSGVYYDVTVFHGRVADIIWPRTRNTPEFLKMLDMCKQLDAWLKADPCNVVMLQDLPDLVSCVYLSTAFLLYCGLFTDLRTIGTYLTTHLPTPQKLVLLPSLRRYYNYISYLVKDPVGNVPHKKRVCIKQIRITPCSFAEDCEIVVELLCRDGVVYSSQEEGGVRLLDENAVEFNMATLVESDIQVRVHSPNNRGFSVTTTNRTLVCALQLYSGYMKPETGRMKFYRKDFDSVSTSSYRLQDLAMQLTYEVMEQEFICPIESVLPKLSTIPTCCSSKEECVSFQQLYELRTANRANLSQRSAVPAAPPHPSPPEPDLPLISMDTEPTGESRTQRPGIPPRPSKPKFKDTMDESGSSSSSSSSSSDSSAGEAALGLGIKNEYESLIGQEYEFNPHFQSDSTHADSVNLITPSEPLITTEYTGQTTQQILPPSRVQAMPVSDDVILDLSDHAPIQPDPPAAMPQAPLITGLSELIITDTQSQKSGTGIDDLFTVPYHNTNPMQTSTDIFSSDNSTANIDPVMQPDGTNTKPAKSSDPWDAFNMNSLSSKSNNQGTLFENPNVQNYSSFPKEPVRQSSPKPNYMSAGFSQPQAQKRGDVFGEILKDSGFPQHKDEAHTLNEMNKSNLLEVIGDPDKLKVMEWSKAKQSNIRGLLSSLHEMAWEGVRWKQIGMHDLMEPSQVKKSYLRASLAFHPDKHIGSPSQNLARLIVIELNEAHTRFEDGGSMQHRVF